MAKDVVRAKFERMKIGSGTAEFHFDSLTVVIPTEQMSKVLKEITEKWVTPAKPP